MSAVIESAMDAFVSMDHEGRVTEFNPAAERMFGVARADVLGQELASSDAFAHCQVTKVFQAVCFRAPNSAADQATVATIKASFKSGGYRLKQVFQLSAAACPGQ